MPTKKKTSKKTGKRALLTVGSKGKLPYWATARVNRWHGNVAVPEESARPKKTRLASGSVVRVASPADRVSAKDRTLVKELRGRHYHRGTLKFTDGGLGTHVGLYSDLLVTEKMTKQALAKAIAEMHEGSRGPQATSLPSFWMSYPRAILEVIYSEGYRPSRHESK
jgi:hypothetical protein